MNEPRLDDWVSGRRVSLRDLRDHASGHAALLRERLFTKRVRYDSITWAEAARALGEVFGRNAREVLSEPALRATEARTRRLLTDIQDEDPFLNRWAADSILARCCYLVCRLTKPGVVVETGVAYGVSSAFILAALRENGGGALHSVDLRPLRPGASFFQGIAVPEEDKTRWTLHPGASHRLLPPLLEHLGGVDFFLHDSLHTRRNMSFEFALALRYLNPQGVLLADDVERNAAFSRLMRDTPGLARVVCDRETEPLHGNPSPTVFGMAVPNAPKP